MNWCKEDNNKIVLQINREREREMNAMNLHDDAIKYNLLPIEACKIDELETAAQTSCRSKRLLRCSMQCVYDSDCNL